MKRILILIVLSFLFYNLIYGQSEALQNQIASDKREAASEGYSLLDSGGGQTNYDWVLTFDPEKYYSGYNYMVVVYLEGCSYCDIGLYFLKSSNGGVEELFPKIERAGGVVRAIYKVQQTVTSGGTVSAYAKSNDKVYTYSMLFRKSSY